MYACTDILQRALQDTSVQSNPKKRAQIVSKRDSAIKKADSLKKAIAEKR